MSTSPKVPADIAGALAHTAETAQVDFKSAFNPGDKGELLEVVKDIVAMANSGGGYILFGLKDNGTPSAADLSALAGLDPAKVTDAIYKYTDCQFQNFELRKAVKGEHHITALCVGTTDVPIVFSQTGNYADGSGKQRNAFLGGTVYFRHGAKSEPANTEDLRYFIERRLEAIRSDWLDKIATVVEAPTGSVIQVLRPGSLDPSGGTPVKLVADASAATTLPVGAIDDGWPHRQKEVVLEFNKVLSGRKTINASHILHVRRAYDIEKRGDFCYTQKHVSPKYSRAFVDWLVQQFNADEEFFEKAKATADRKRDMASMAEVNASAI